MEAQDWGIPGTPCVHARTVIWCMSWHRTLGMGLNRAPGVPWVLHCPVSPCQDSHRSVLHAEALVGMGPGMEAWALGIPSVLHCPSSPCQNSCWSVLNTKAWVGMDPGMEAQGAGDAPDPMVPSVGTHTNLCFLRSKDWTWHGSQQGDTEH